ncbi:MAG: fibronectin type III domain-containing protein [Weeksellaceae bacterium]|nr:fibronectin type III domain-containing protein [Weeksellaceae bacterium]
MKRFYFLTAILLSFWQLSAQTYCTPAFASGCAGGDLIDDFTVASAGFSHTATGCSANAYEDFSATQTLTVQPSLVYNFLVTHGYSGQYVAMWADFNNDGTFDPTTELIGSGQSANVGGTDQTSSTLTVPATVTPGNYRMRVAVRWLSNPIPCNTDGYGEAHDYTLTVTTPPTCIAPGNFAASNILTTSAMLTWTAPTTPPANGYTVYYSTVNTAPTASTVLNPTNSVSTANLTTTLSGLNPNTTYYVWIRTNCTTTDQSIWIGLPSILTACAPVTSMFENFDSYATGSIVPNCWARIVPASDPGTQTITSTTPASGTRNIYQYAGSTQTPVTVVLPVFSNINAGTHWLRFKARVSTAPGDLEVGYVTDPTDGATFVTLSTISITNTTYTTGADYTVNVPTTVPAGARLAIRNAADNNSYYWDDVYWEVIPTCIMPSGVSISGPTTTGATVNWIPASTAPAGGYQVYYSTVNTAPTAATVLDGTNSVSSPSSPANLTNLNPATVYYVWVRSYCSSTDQSVWVSGGSITTSCLVATIPFFDGFENGNTHNTAVGCWTQSSVTGTALWTANNSLTTYNRSPRTGAWNAFLLYGNENWMVRAVNLTGGTSYTFQVYARQDGATASDADITLAYGSSSDPATFTTIVGPTAIINGAYQKVSGAFTPATTGVYYIAIKGNISFSPWYISIDDINLDVTPTCVEPSALTMGTVTQNTADISWAAPTASTPVSYTVYYSTTNTAPTPATVLNTTNSVTVTAPNLSATINGLAPATTYYVWVRSNCSTADMSAWNSAGMFMTQCDATNAPYVMNFEGITPPAMPGCTSVLNSGSGNMWFTATAPGYGFTSNALQYSYNFSEDADTWFFTRGINMVAGTTYYIHYKYGNNSTTYSENLKVAIGNSATAAAMVNVIGDHVGIQDAVMHEVSNVAFTPTTSGVYYVGFQSYSLANQYYLYVDDIQVTATQLSTVEVGTAVNAPAKVYPNPFTDVVNITDAKDLKSVSVVDMSGRLVKTIANPGRQINLGELKAGLYILKLDYKDGSVKTVKAIKK